MRTILLVVAALLFAAPTWAQTDVEKEEAQKRFDEGLKLHDANNDNEARLKFAQAWAVLKRPNVLFNLARSEQLSSHPVEALVHFEDFVKMPGISSQDKDDAEHRIIELKKQVGTVDVKGAPEGAKIVIDDQWTGATAPALGEIHAMPGKRIVEVRTSTKSYRKEVTCEASQTTTVSFVEEVRANPPDGYIPPDTEPRKSMFPPPAGAIVLMGVGLVGIGLGVGFAVDSSGKDSDARKLGPCAGPMDPACQKARELRDSQGTSASIATAGIVIGSVMVAGGVAWWIIAPRKVRQSGFVPSVSPTFVGATYSHSF